MSMRDTVVSLLPDAVQRDFSQLSPLVLAYMGDCVYDLYVRTLLVSKSDATAHNMHLMAANMVCAAAQAEASRRVMPMLTEREAAVFRRGRNAHMGTIARNATIADYRAATGLEAVLGYIYMQGDDARLNALMEAALTSDEIQGDLKGEHERD